MKKKIEDQLRESHEDSIKWALDRVGLASVSGKITGEKVFIDFLEVCQRRHILMHNGGIVNEAYIFKCTKAGVDPKELPSLGDEIVVDAAYFKRAVARAYQTGLYILHMYIQKQFSTDRNASFHNLLNVSHSFLLANQTKMCARVCEFAEFSKNKLGSELTCMFAVNKALSALHDPKKDDNQQLKSAKQILSNYDWSGKARDPIFNLVLACIRREWDSLSKLAIAAKSAGLTYEDVRTWAAFKEARKREGFLDHFPRSPLGLL